MQSSKNSRYNFMVYGEGMGFLVSIDDGYKNPLFAESADSALTYKKKDAEKIAIDLCDDFNSVWVMKKCSEMQSSKNMK